MVANIVEADCEMLPQMHRLAKYNGLAVQSAKHASRRLIRTFNLEPHPFGFACRIVFHFKLDVVARLVFYSRIHHSEFITKSGGRGQWLCQSTLPLTYYKSSGGCRPELDLEPFPPASFSASSALCSSSRRASSSAA
jgi:hypothetical protein